MSDPQHRVDPADLEGQAPPDPTTRQAILAQRPRWSDTPSPSSGGSGGADAKVKVMSECGFIISESPSGLGEAVVKAIEEWK